jgi:cobalt-zinc-cadmium efflux system outer membrane protein
VKDIVHEVSLLLAIFCFATVSVWGQEKLSLDNAIDIALQNNTDILRAEREVDAATGRILQAGRIANPEFGVEWNGTPTNFNLGDADERDITLSQSIEFPTRRARRIDVANVEKDIVGLRLDRKKLLVRAEVSRAYYRAVYSQQIVSNLRSQIELLKDVSSIIQSRYEGGSVGYLDVIRAKVELTRTGNDLTEAQREQRIRYADIQILLGRNADENVELTDSLALDLIPTKPDSLLQHLIETSNALRIVRRAVQRGENNLSLAKTTYLPDFDLGIAFQHRTQEPPFSANDFTGTTNNALGIRFGVSIPFWFWQEPKGQVQEASTLVDIAKLNEGRTAREIRASILAAISGVNVAAEQVRVFRTSLLIDVDDILATGIQQYRNNQIDMVNLFDIYRTSRTARGEYLRALLNYAVARADLDVAAELPLEE